MRIGLFSRLTVGWVSQVATLYFDLINRVMYRFSEKHGFFWFFYKRFYFLKFCFVWKKRLLNLKPILKIQNLFWFFITGFKNNQYKDDKKTKNVVNIIIVKFVTSNATFFVFLSFLYWSNWYMASKLDKSS